MSNKVFSILVIALALLVPVGCSGSSSNAESGSSGAAGSSEIVVKFGDESFTLAEVDEKSRAISLKPYQDLYDQRKLAIEQMVAERLIKNEAEARGVTQEELIAAEVEAECVRLLDHLE